MGFWRPSLPSQKFLSTYAATKGTELLAHCRRTSYGQRFARIYHGEVTQFRFQPRRPRCQFEHSKNFRGLLCLW
jgi:hypothetical protein